MLPKLNDMGAVLAQVQPIGNAAVLLATTIALVQSCSTAVYSVKAIQEVNSVQPESSCFHSQMKKL